MHFIQSPFLYALAGLAIPVIMHLIFRWQTRRVELGTTRFLSELLRETSRRRKLKRWLLLAMRLACVALLAFLFARPFVLARQAGQTGRLVVVLLDRSASMALAPEGQRLVDLGIERVAELTRDSGPNTIVETALFDTSVAPVQPLADGAATAASPLSVPEQLWGATSYGTAMSWARDLCLKSTASERVVYVLTDLQRSGLDWTDTAPFPLEVQVHIEDLGRDVGNNAAIIRTQPQRSLLRPGQGTTVEATLFNYGNFSHVDLPVQLTLRNGARTVRLQQKASLRPGEAMEVTFELASVEAGLWEGNVLVDIEDDLAFDNVRHFALLAAPQQKVLVIDGSNARNSDSTDTWFLERALRLSGDDAAATSSPFQTTVIRPDAEPLPPVGQFDLVVLANADQLSTSESERLAEFVRNGGGLLVFPGDRMSTEGCNTLAAAGLTPGDIQGVQSTSDLPFRWSDWEDRHPALAPFSDPQNGDLRRLAHRTYLQIAPGERTSVLARFNTGDPALAEQTIDRGRVLWFLSGCNRDWSDWVRSRLFLPLVHQLLGDLAQLTGGGPIQSRVLGDPNPESGVSPGATLAEPQRPAVVPSGERFYVFNVNPRESEDDRCSPQEFAERFRFQWIPEPSGGEVATAVPSNSGLETRRNEAWPWVACALIGLLGLEWFLANRTTA